MVIVVVYIVVILILINYLIGSKSSCCEGMSDNKITAYWFHRPGCPHCDRMESAWGKLSPLLPANYSAVAVNTTKSSNKALASKYNVSGVPHIIKVDAKGKLISTYNGDRSTSDMKKWILG